MTWPSNSNCHGIARARRKWHSYQSAERVNICHAKLESLKLPPYISHSWSLNTIQTPSFQAEEMTGADQRSPAPCVTFLCSARMALSIAPQAPRSWRISFEKSIFFFLLLFGFHCLFSLGCVFKPCQFLRLLPNMTRCRVVPAYRDEEKNKQELRKKKKKKKMVKKIQGGIAAYTAWIATPRPIPKS